MHHIFVASAVAVLTSLLADPCAADDAADFVGTWTLEAFEILNDAGEWEEFTGHSSDAYFNRVGPSPVGMITYSKSGYMTAQVMGKERNNFGSDDLSQIEAEIIKSAFTAYSAYFGTYEVREAEGVVLHRRIGNLVPDYVGTEVTRAYELDGDRLMLSGTPESRLVWRRLD